MPSIVDRTLIYGSAGVRSPEKCEKVLPELAMMLMLLMMMMLHLTINQVR